MQYSDWTAMHIGAIWYRSYKEHTYWTFQRTEQENIRFQTTNRGDRHKQAYSLTQKPTDYIKSKAIM